MTDAMSVGFLLPTIGAIESEPVTVICGPERDDGLDRARDLDRQPGVSVVRIGWRRDIAPLRDLWALVTAVRLLRRLRPRVVHAATPKASLLMMCAATIAGVPVRIASVWGLRSEGESASRARVVRLAERLTDRLSTVVTCNSQSLAEEYVRRIRGSIPVVVGAGSSHGVDVERFGDRTRTAAVVDRLRRDLGIGATDRVVLFVGRLHPDKGVAELREIAARLRPDTHLIIVGPDELTDAAGRDAEASLRASARTHVVGPVADSAPWFHLASLVVLPSRREGFPNVVLEAAAAGVPTVGYAATGTVDAIVDGVTGWLVALGDTEAFAETVDGALDDPGAVERRGAAGQLRAARDFRPGSIARETVALYGPAPRAREFVVIAIGGQERWARSLAASFREHSDLPVMTVLSPRDVVRVPRGATWVWVGYRPGARTVRGRAFDAAALVIRTVRRPRLWVHYWIGTDVHNAVRESSGPSGVLRTLPTRHIAAAPWLKESLEELGFTATAIPFPVPLPRPVAPEIALRRPVLLSYVPDADPRFYGGPELLGLARRHPSVQLRIMGGEGGWATDVPDNVTFLGWANAEAEYAKARVVLRLVAHDAIGGTMREGLAAGLQVVYTYDYPGCRFVAWPVEPSQLDAAVSAALAVDSYNERGIDHVTEELAPEKLVERLTRALDA